jgi:hypothetical protein
MDVAGTILIATGFVITDGGIVRRVTPPAHMHCSTIATLIWGRGSPAHVTQIGSFYWDLPTKKLFIDLRGTSSFNM